jgi:hypothetical protein
MQIWWRLKTFVNHRIRNASKGITLALCFDVVDLISIGVDLGRGLGFYQEEETPEMKITHSIQMHRCANKHDDMTCLGVQK